MDQKQQLRMMEIMDRFYKPFCRGSITSLLVFVAFCMLSAGAASADEPTDSVLKGGSIRLAITDYPSNIRRLGPGLSGNTLMRQITDSQLPLVYVDTSGEVTPLLAERWTITPERICFTINPAARWSDGWPVSASDLVFTVNFILSGDAATPVLQTTLSEHVARAYVENGNFCASGVRDSDEALFRVTAGIQPLAEHVFLKHKGWPDAYDWYPEPTTGAYHISQINHGREITFSRTKDWWAADLPFFRERFNIDRIEYTIEDDPLAAFASGEIDLVIFSDSEESLHQFKHISSTRKIGIISIEGASKIYSLFFLNSNRTSLSERPQRQLISSILERAFGNASPEGLPGELLSVENMPEYLSLSYTDSATEADLKQLTTYAENTGIHIALDYFELKDFSQRLSLGQFDLAMLSFDQALSDAAFLSLFSSKSGAVYIANPGAPAHLILPAQNNGQAATKLREFMAERKLLVEAEQYSNANTAFWEWLHNPSASLPDVTQAHLSLFDIADGGRWWIRKKDRADILAQPARRHNKGPNYTRIRRQSDAETNTTTHKKSDS